MPANHNGAAGVVRIGTPDDGTGRDPIDAAAVRRAARELLQALGADVDSEGLHDRPRRVADPYAEL